MNPLHRQQLARKEEPQSLEDYQERRTPIVVFTEGGHDIVGLVLRLIGGVIFIGLSVAIVWKGILPISVTDIDGASKASVAIALIGLAGGSLYLSYSLIFREFVKNPFTKGGGKGDK